MRRYNYVTPTSYLQLLATFRAVLREKRDEIGTARRRLSVGLDKISATEKDVAQMQVDLKELQPVLVKTSAEVEDLMVKIAKDKEDAAEKKGLFARIFSSLARKKEPVEMEIAPQAQSKKKAKRLAVKCDQCMGHGFVACVYNCPTGAIERVKSEKLYELL